MHMKEIALTYGPDTHGWADKIAWESMALWAKTRNNAGRTTQLRRGAAKEKSESASEQY